MLNGVAGGQSSFLKKLHGKLPVLAKLETADEETVCAELRVLMEVWMYSGKDPNHPDSDTPSMRNLTTVHPSSPQTLLTFLNQWKDRHPPKLHFSDAGEVSFVYDEPEYRLEGGLFGAPKGKTVPSDIAVYWFIRLLDSPGARSLSRCAGCGMYFAYLRTPKDTLKNGTFCNRCKANRSSVQTTAKRKSHKNKLVQSAAKFWLDQKPTSKTKHKDFVAKKINHDLSLKPDHRVTGKWVVQNTAAIERYLANKPA